MLLSPYGRNEWLTILAIGGLLLIATLLTGWWILAILVVIATAALLSFFRDPDRPIPSHRNVMVAPADGKVSSIHTLDHFAPLDGPATCVRIFLSVLDVHVNRSPCHGQVTQVTHKPGDHLNALNPQSAEVNESTLIVMLHPTRRYPVAAVRQVAGLLARTIACGVKEGDIVQRGQRIGMIKLGSTTELYIPADLQPEVVVEVGQKVKAGMTVLANIVGKENAATKITVRRADETEPEGDSPSPAAANGAAES